MSGPLIRSSLPLQVLLFFNGWYDALFTVMMLVLYVWKANTLPYPAELHGVLSLEIALVFVLSIIEYARIFLGSRGNKTEQTGPLFWFVIFSTPALAVNIYYMLLQVYVTRLDLILNATSIGFVGAEVLLALLTLVTFVNAPAGTS